MGWLEKQAEVLVQLQSDVEVGDMKWLRTNVDLDCADLNSDATTTEYIRERFRYRGHLNQARVTRTFIWQCWIKIKAGELDPVEGNIRSFWYQYLEDFYRGHNLFKPEFSQPPAATPYIESSPKVLDGPADEDDMASFELVGRISAEDVLIDTMTRLMADFATHHIFRLGGEFQFQRPTGNKTLIGRDRKKLLFFTEKEGIWPTTCLDLHKAKNKHSISVMASDGEPTLLTLEYFVEDFKENGVSELIIGAMCDYDPWGFWIAWNLDRKLRSFRRQGEKDSKGKLVPYFKSITTYLLTTPDLFTDENIAKARDLSDFRDQTLIKHWMAVTHGIHGKPLAIHVDKVNKILRRQRADDWIQDILGHVAPPYPKLPKNAPKYEEIANSLRRKPSYLT